MRIIAINSTTLRVDQAILTGEQSKIQSLIANLRSAIFPLSSLTSLIFGFLVNADSILQ